MVEAGARSDGATESLELIAAMNRDFVTSLDLELTLKRALEHIVAHVGAEGGALFLTDEEKKGLVCHACIGPIDITGILIPKGQGIVGRCVRDDRGQIVKDTSQDPDFYNKLDDETGFVTRSLLCAPMSVKELKLGAIELANKRTGNKLFAEADLALLETLASSAALAILNARMAGQLVEQEKMRRELELAAQIQRSLLPASQPAPFPVVGVNRPARVVSGDFFDHFQAADGRILFCVGDVSGKGMNAALLMAKTASLFRCLGKEEASPGKLLARINDEICETNTLGMFVTMAAGIYDPVGGHVVLANAGHEPPLLWGMDEKFEPIAADSPPLGIVPSLDAVPEAHFDLGDRILYIFTDGMTESRLDGEQLGEAGVRKLIAATPAVDLSQHVKSIAAQIAGCCVAKDDLTLLALGREGGRDIKRNGYRAVLQMCVPAKADQLKKVRDKLSPRLRDLGCSVEIGQDIVLAVDEALQNVVRHAYAAKEGDMIVLLWHKPHELLFEVRDFAPPVDPAKIKPRALDDIRPGGLGTHFIRTTMDEVSFDRPDWGTGNLLRLKKTIR